MREISWFVFPFFLGGAALPDRYANSRCLCLSVCACLFIFSVSLNLVVRQRLVYSPGAAAGKAILHRWSGGHVILAAGRGL